MEKTYDTAIIGGSLAGLTAGIYCGRKKMSTVLLTKKIGGQNLLTSDIENYPGFFRITGPEITDKIIEQVKSTDVEVRDGEEVETVEKSGDLFVLKTKNGQTINAKTIIVATGRIMRYLNVPGEKEFQGKGVSACSICDAPLFGGKDVAVVGSGNSGLESIVDLLNYANKIYLLDSSDKMRGDEVMQERILKSGKVEVITGVEITEIKGGNLVEGLVYKNIKSGEEKEIKVGGVFIHIGWVPASGAVSGLVDLNKKDEIVVNSGCCASVSGVFAAGDVNDGPYKQLIIAAGDGAKAALSAYDYLMSKK